MSSGRDKIVLLGMMTKMPVAGVAWLMVHYLVGFRRLGYDPYYVEAHARTPSMFMEHERDDGASKAAAYIDRVLRRFDFGDRWAYHALHEDRRCYGLSDSELERLYREAALILNLHGGTLPLPEHGATGRLVYLETDPVELQVELHKGVREAVDFLEPHVAFFSWGLNYGSPDCKVPLPDRFHFRPTCPPVLLDLWPPSEGEGEAFTTVGNWQQRWRDVWLQGEIYTWSKHHEFLKVLDLPRRSGRRFELALSSCEESDRRMLEEHGWHVRPGLEISGDLDTYRSFISGSRGEFTVAKDQNVRLRSGWFSERSATYLAAGRPVITQETGFSNVLPTGEGLFSFSTLEEAAAAVEAMEGDYERHRRAARELGREHFAAEKVLSQLVSELGLETRKARSRQGGDPLELPEDLVLEPVSRRPTTLRQETVDAVLARPLPEPRLVVEGEPKASIVVVSFDGLAFTRLCLESILANTGAPAYEIIVVDNASSDGSREYLSELARGDPGVRAIVNESNAGFPRATNQGLAEARGGTLVLLNNDTIVPPGWLTGLERHLSDPAVGAVGPVTNRIGNEAQIDAPYSTYGEFLAFARDRAREHAGEAFDVPTLTMFCLAVRRDVYERVGPLDERFGPGLLEDDDYAVRLQLAGLRSICAEDVVVHHFGEGSFGALVPTGSYGALLERNQKLFEEKWRTGWRGYGRRQSTAYEELARRVRQRILAVVPPGASVAVATRGDESLLALPERRGCHFPETAGGVYGGYYPADSEEAITWVESLRERGVDYLVFPRTAFWWLDHYGGLAGYLRPPEYADDACRVFALEDGARSRRPVTEISAEA